MDGIFAGLGRRSRPLEHAGLSPASVAVCWSSPTSVPSWPRDRRPPRQLGCALSGKHLEVPGEHLAQPGNPHDPMGELWEVAGPRVDHAEERMVQETTEHGSDMEREQRLAEHVLRLATCSRRVAPSRSFTAGVVPRRRLVTTPGGEPVGEREPEMASWPQHPGHLLDDRERLGDVLEHVGGDHEVDGARADRQRASVRHDRPRRGRSPPGKLSGVGVDEHATSARRPQGAGEVPRTTPDVEGEQVLELQRVAEQFDRVGRQPFVEGVGVLLLASEASQEPQRASDGPARGPGAHAAGGATALQTIWRSLVQATGSRGGRGSDPRGERAVAGLHAVG
jgi:hypothetical protein